VQAYVLIGGRSRRMGVSKTALFLERILSAARPVFDEVVAVQRPGGEAAGGIRTIYESAHEGDGAIFGVVAALREARARCFVLAVDYPLVTSELLRYLAEHGGVPVWNGWPQPLCAVWDPAALPRLEERIARGSYGLQELVEQEIIPEPVLRARFPGEPLMNVNTPEELEAAERLYGQ
jgi:molybdopterin-guanine dinucleotide biosynthesis protein A